MLQHRLRSAAARVFVVVAIGLWLATTTGELMADNKHIVYIEASTVNNWKLDGFAARTGVDRYRFEVLREYDFDKSTLVAQVLRSDSPRPDAVILQECSTYFPGDLQAYQRMYREWVERLQARGLRVVIATVVPPANSSGWWQDSKNFVKERLLGRPGRLQQVVAFNGWLRTLGAERNIPIFDLEQLLRVSAEDPHMRADFSAGDGVHLAPVAYQHLDRELLEFLDRFEWRSVPK